MIARYYMKKNTKRDLLMPSLIETFISAVLQCVEHSKDYLCYTLGPDKEGHYQVEEVARGVFIKDGA